MKIIIYTLNKKLHQHRAEALCKGINKHGRKAIVAPYSNKFVLCDLAVVWGVHHPKRIIQFQRAKGNDYLVMEAGYIKDRGKWLSLGYNGLNGRADFVNKNSPPDRWNKHFSDLIKPWRETKGEYVLVTGQVTGDASLIPTNGRVDYQNIVNELRQYTNLPIHYRRHPHPNRPTAPCPKGAINSIGTLEQALSKAYCVVTFNSNTCVDAILAGVPCVVLDNGAMTWDISQHNLRHVHNLMKAEREQWAYDMAYTQWTVEEMESGEAWEHCKGKYE